MITANTLQTLTEEEISILFFIVEKSMPWLQPNFNFIKLLRKDITLRIIDVLKRQAIPEKQSIFDTLKEKLAAE